MILDSATFSVPLVSESVIVILVFESIASECHFLSLMRTKRKRKSESELELEVTQIDSCFSLFSPQGEALLLLSQPSPPVSLWELPSLSDVAASSLGYVTC